MVCVVFVEERNARTARSPALLILAVISSCPTTWARCRRRRRHWEFPMSWRSPNIRRSTRAAPPTPPPPLLPHPLPQSRCPSSPRSPLPHRTVKVPLASSHPSPWTPWKPRPPIRWTAAMTEENKMSVRGSSLEVFEEEQQHGQAEEVAFITIESLSWLLLHSAHMGIYVEMILGLKGTVWRCARKLSPDHVEPWQRNRVDFLPLFYMQNSSTYFIGWRVRDSQTTWNYQYF